eukprot:gene16834-25816_t
MSLRSSDAAHSRQPSLLGSVQHLAQQDVELQLVQRKMDLRAAEAAARSAFAGQQEAELGSILLGLTATVCKACASPLRCYPPPLVPWNTWHCDACGHARSNVRVYACSATPEECDAAFCEACIVHSACRAVQPAPALPTPPAAGEKKPPPAEKAKPPRRPAPPKAKRKPQPPPPPTPVPPVLAGVEREEARFRGWVEDFERDAWGVLARFGGLLEEQRSAAKDRIERAVGDPSHGWNASKAAEAAAGYSFVRDGALAALPRGVLERQRSVVKDRIERAVGDPSHGLNASKAAEAAAGYSLVRDGAPAALLRGFSEKLATWYAEKPGDVVLELLENLRYAPGETPLAALRTVARALAPKDTGGHSLAELLCLRQYTQRPLDIDRDLGWPRVPDADSDASEAAAYEAAYSDWDWGKPAASGARNGSIFGPVCAALRDQGPGGARGAWSERVLKKWIKWLMTVGCAAARPCEPGQTLWRGLGGGRLGGGVVEGHRAMRPGDLLGWPALSSTSFDQRASVEYMKGTAANSVARPSASSPGTILFKVSGASRGVTVTGISQYPEESEMLLSPCNVFRIETVAADNSNPFRNARGEPMGLLVSMVAEGPVFDPSFHKTVLNDARHASKRLQSTPADSNASTVQGLQHQLSQLSRELESLRAQNAAKTSAERRARQSAEGLQNQLSQLSRELEDRTAQAAAERSALQSPPATAGAARSLEHQVARLSRELDARAKQTAENTTAERRALLASILPRCPARKAGGERRPGASADAGNRRLPPGESTGSLRRERSGGQRGHAGEERLFGRGGPAADGAGGVSPLECAGSGAFSEHLFEAGLSRASYGNEDSTVLRSRVECPAELDSQQFVDLVSRLFASAVEDTVENRCSSHLASKADACTMTRDLAACNRNTERAPSVVQEMVRDTSAEDALRRERRETARLRADLSHAAREVEGLRGRLATAQRAILGNLDGVSSMDSELRLSRKAVRWLAAALLPDGAQPQLPPSRDLPSNFSSCRSPALAQQQQQQQPPPPPPRDLPSNFSSCRSPAFAQQQQLQQQLQQPRSRGAPAAPGSVVSFSSARRVSPPRLPPPSEAVRSAMAQTMDPLTALSELQALAVLCPGLP